MSALFSRLALRVLATKVSSARVRSAAALQILPKRLKFTDIQSEEQREADHKKWKDKLTPGQYAVCRLKGTEKPFTGPYLHNREKGIYTCVCCGAKLFESHTKFDSGSGWPSFYDVHSTGDTTSAVRLEDDWSLGVLRREVLCAKCHAHLGHVFPDGPKPTGLRYCINGVALMFIPEKPGPGGEL